MRTERPKRHASSSYCGARTAIYSVPGRTLIATKTVTGTATGTLYALLLAEIAICLCLFGIDVKVKLLKDQGKGIIKIAKGLGLGIETVKRSRWNCNYGAVPSSFRLGIAGFEPVTHPTLSVVLSETCDAFKKDMTS